MKLIHSVNNEFSSFFFLQGAVDVVLSPVVLAFQMLVVKGERLLYRERQNQRIKRKKRH